jgi:hypothetical protein
MRKRDLQSCVRENEGEQIDERMEKSENWIECKLEI